MMADAGSGPRTLLLAEAPWRDLTSRATLEEALGAIPHGSPALLVAGMEAAPPGCALVPPGAVPAGVEQVVLAGPFLDRAALEQALATAGGAVAAGARLVVHNLALEGTAAAIDAPAGAAVLERAARLGLRDHRSANVLTLWRIEAPMRILAFPERHVAPDPLLAEGLPGGNILGLAIRGGADMRRSWLPRLPAITRLLARAEGWAVLPLPIRMPGTAEDDLAATAEIAATALPGAPLLLPGLADPASWRQAMTPPRLKALVARCRLVATNIDLVAAYAVACGVPVLGLALGADRRIVSCLATLANDLPAGSALRHPAPGRNPDQPPSVPRASSSARA